jgi:hypothetical protein
VLILKQWVLPFFPSMASESLAHDYTSILVTCSKQVVILFPSHHVTWQLFYMPIKHANANICKQASYHNSFSIRHFCTSSISKTLSKFYSLNHHVESHLHKNYFYIFSLSNRQQLFYLLCALQRAILVFYI